MALSVNQLAYGIGGLAEQRPKRDTQTPDEKHTIFRAFRSWSRSALVYRVSLSSLVVPCNASDLFDINVNSSQTNQNELRI